AASRIDVLRDLAETRCKIAASANHPGPEILESNVRQLRETRPEGLLDETAARIKILPAHGDFRPILDGVSAQNAPVHRVSNSRSEAMDGNDAPRFGRA